MNILIFNWRDITHPWAGGAERHIHELGRYWVKSGHNVTVVCGGYKGAIRSEKIDGMNYRRLGNTYTIYFLAPFYYITRLRFRRFDVIIDTAHGIPFFSRLYTRRKVVLIIHHNHKKLWQSEWTGLTGKVGSFLESKVVPFLYKKSPVVTLSNSTREELKKHGYQKVYAIPPGVDKFYFANGSKKTEIPTILYLGRLRKYKRVELLISVFPEIQKLVPNVKLIIAGSGQDQSRISHIIRSKGLNSHIELMGYVSEDEKRRLLRTSWVLAFPSLIEGWGLVAMQAAACGTPTVGFKVPGVVDAVNNGKSGILVNNIKEYTLAIAELLTNDLKRTFMSKESQTWAKSYSWLKSSQNFMDVIKKEMD